MSKKFVDDQMKRFVPSRHCLCVFLTGSDHLAGALLERLVYWTERAGDRPSDECGWIAEPKKKLRSDCCLTKAQYARALSKLTKHEFVEQRRRGKIAELRPSKQTLNYIACATTWKAARQFLPVATRAEFRLPARTEKLVEPWLSWLFDEAVERGHSVDVKLSPEEVGLLVLLREMFDEAMERYPSADDNIDWWGEFIFGLLYDWKKKPIPEQPSSPSVAFCVENFDQFFGRF